MELNMELNNEKEAQDGKEVEEIGREDGKKKKKKKQLGGIKTMPFILATEICDRFATVGFHANMITYLTQQLNLPLVKASNMITNLDGTASFTPIVGALIADSFAGRYWTIVGGSIFYELGLISITVTALLKSLRPPPCPTLLNCKEASTFQIGILYMSLFLISLGLGGIRPCVVTFAADQFDMSKAGAASRGWNFFNWYYFCMGMARITALTVVVYIQDNVGWGWGLGIPTIAMAFSFVFFLCGFPLYKKLKPGGSPLVRLAQVIVAAARKRKAVTPEDPNQLYQNKDLDASISMNGRLSHTDQLKWIDKAAIVKDGEVTDSNPPNLWRLSTVHRVEELKTFFRLLPIWAAMILYVTANSHNSSFVIQQARSMDRHLSNSFQIPPASMAIFNNLTMVAGLVLLERLLIPYARKLTGNQAGITCLQRMGIGYVFNILSTIVAAVVETKRKAAAADHNLLDSPKSIIPISVFWLVPQLFLHGVSEVFTGAGQLEFLYDQSPESMRSVAIGLFWIAHGAGNYLGTLFVSLVHEYTGHKNNWLPDRNLNRGKLDYYYWLITGIQAVNLVYYVVCAWFYSYKPLEEVTTEDGSVAEDDHAGNGEAKHDIIETV